jgi:hypothetical protein
MIQSRILGLPILSRSTISQINQQQPSDFADVLFKALGCCSPAGVGGELF